MLPDENVWLALAFEVHPQHPTARDWFNRIDDDRSVCFCRSTQVSFLRLLTQPAALGRKALTQNEAWKAYEQFRNDNRVTFRDEPAELDAVFRRLSARDEISPKRWGDDYLLAFAESCNLTLVTFDRTLAKRTPDAILLSA
jgi:toxin-antitoxin system PIN domain toxin